MFHWHLKFVQLYITMETPHRGFKSHGCTSMHDVNCNLQYVVPQFLRTSCVSGTSLWTPAPPGGSSVRPRPNRDRASPGRTHRDSSLMEVKCKKIQISKMNHKSSSVVTTSQGKIQKGTTAVRCRTSTGWWKDLFGTKSLRKQMKNEESQGLCLDVPLL